MLAAGGFFLQSTLPVNVTFGQALAPVSAATVSSLMMGFAWGTGGLSVPAVGYIADRIGIEHTLVGAPLPGLAVFSGPEYSGTLPILLAFSSAVAAVRALYRWRRSYLVARLRADPAKLPRPNLGSPRRPKRRASAVDSAIARRLAGRAPPAPAVA